MNIFYNISKLFVFIIVFYLNLYAQQDVPSKNYDFFQNYSKKNTFTFTDTTQLNAYIESMMNQYHIPGLSAAIVRGNRLIWSQTYGYQNLTTNKPVNDSTQFLLASVSKPVTATALMKLWEKGFFGLDEDINNFLSFSVRNPNHLNTPITFRMLLTHTSSINDTWTVLNPLYILNNDYPIPIETFLENYLVQGGWYYNSSNFDNVLPGSQGNYTNIGTSLIACLVDSISNNSFEQFCQDSLFIPLGMNHTSWFLNNLDTTNIAIPYQYISPHYYNHSHYGVPFYPASQLRTSAIQLAHFVNMFLNHGKLGDKQILDSTTVELMTTEQVPSINPNVCLMWWKGTLTLPFLGSRETCSHVGGFYGCRAIAEFTIDSKEKVGVAIIFNSQPDDVLYLLRDELFIFSYFHDRILPENVIINPHYMSPGIDTLIINSEFMNPYSHSMNANAIINSIDQSYKDTLQLFDDGNHGDSLSGDGIWGNFILPLQDENTFAIDVNTTDSVSGEYFVLSKASQFTSAGPVEVINTILFADSVRPGERIPIKLVLRNLGTTTPVMDISANIFSIDTSLSNVYISINPIYGNILPGDSSETVGGYYIDINQNCPIYSDVFFEVEIESNGFVCWTDTFSIFINAPSGTGTSDNFLPKKYELDQNYPNPFNPTTIIRYTLPNSEKVKIEVFNLLGQRVETLLDKQMPAGTYDVVFTAKDLPSGVYLYRIEAGEYQEMRKMILLK